MRDDTFTFQPISTLLDRLGVPSRWRRRLLSGVRAVYVIGRDVIDGPIPLHAASLVYSTLLSLVPMIAISFSVLKGFGVHNQLEPTLLRALAPLGNKAEEVAQRIIGFVDRMDVGVLGALGLGFLVYTVISVIQKAEAAFNQIWGIRKPRSWIRKFADYLSVLLVAPVLIFAAVGVAASVRSTILYQHLASVALLGRLLDSLGQILPELLVLAALMFTYLFLPNTRVKPAAALAGAVSATGLWLGAAWGFAHFAAGASSYEAIYSAFAAAVLFLIWIYVVWIVVLIGAEVAFLVQEPAAVAAPIGMPEDACGFSPRQALALMTAVGEAFQRGCPVATAENLAVAAGLRRKPVAAALKALVEGGILVETGEQPSRFLPARPLELTPLVRVLEVIRGAEPRGAGCEGLESLSRAVDEAVDRVLADRTLKDLIEPRTASPGQPPPAAGETSGARPS